MSPSAISPSAMDSSAMGPSSAIALVDFGSTFTKVRAVAPDGRMVGCVQRRTTIEGDILDGLSGGLAELERVSPDAEVEEILACSSAGGGLRMAVVGLVEDLTAEAARQVALGAGARVLTVYSGGLRSISAARELASQQPDIIMLAGGTDGGDGEALLASARFLAAVDLRVPVLVAGNEDAQLSAVAILEESGVTVVRAANVLPEIDRLTPEPARRAIRELFISHVIGGKFADSSARLKEMIRMATPDAALTGVGLLAEVIEQQGGGPGVVVVDVGGATTDVHSHVAVDDRLGYKRSLLPQAATARTVEADLGVRWNAGGILQAARHEDLLSAEQARILEPAVERRVSDPGFLPDSAEELDVDRLLARLAIAAALRRHAGTRRVLLSADGAVVEHRGRDLSGVRTLIGTGGVFTSMKPSELQDSLELARSGREQRLLPEPGEVRAGVDRQGTIVAAGVLAARSRELALSLLHGRLDSYLTNDQEQSNVLATG